MRAKATKKLKRQTIPYLVHRLIVRGLDGRGHQVFERLRVRAQAPATRKRFRRIDKIVMEG